MIQAKPMWKPTKVKIFSEWGFGARESVENKINDFIEDNYVIDIKYSTCETNGGTRHSALIIYQEG